MLNKNINKKNCNNSFISKNTSESSIKIFGFWIYLMSDFIIFAALLATYSVLRNGIYNGPSEIKIFNCNKVVIETFILYFSSISYDISMSYSKENKNKKVQIWLLITLILGCFFIFIETNELYSLIIKGFIPSKSAFLSSLFVLLITHGIHLIIGIIWIILVFIKILYYGLTKTNKTKLKCLSLFWHFLDIIWMCIYSIVYMIGVT
ncbi:cytochrome c oxidase subunit 3 [Sodalis-like secondary symbiont of Drepanosiphum platanoidis]|uniref:cytochrome c oxidase subunit 3 n=1 Tax=Sodalis-like secondary symbiont of Drepanosiphum platanoidis TaxID=2994493 RepID=UPI003464A86D